MVQPIEEFSARPYQIDLYERAVQYNSIIYLPTGAGKTYIAVMIIKKLSGDVIKPYSVGGKRTIFAVNTVALADQQLRYLQRHTHLNCSSYTGEMQVDYWSRDKWLQELEDNQVLVMTSQIFLDILNHGYISLSQVNLMIFDECHRAVNDHPMRLIMQRFKDCPKDQQPRVLGLTATLLNGNIKVAKLDETITDLETTFHGKIIAVESLIGVRGYATNPIESIVRFSPPLRLTVLESTMARLIQAREILKIVEIKIDHEMINKSDNVFKPKSKSNKFQNVLSDLEEHVKLMGIYGGSKAALLHTIQLEYIKKSINNQETVFVIDYLITVLTSIRKIVEDEMEGYEPNEQIMKFSSDQVLKLFKVFLDFNREKLDSQRFCCLVFVQRRFTAKVLYHVLRNLHNTNENYKFLLAEFMVGFSANPYDSARESLCQRKWNKEVLHKLKNGQANCIIATDVIEEGVDVPDCTLVVRYNLPMDIRSYIQSKGRARHATSKYIILVPSNDDQFAPKYANFKLIEQKLEQFLIGKSQFRTEPTPETLDQDLYTNEIEPYAVTNTNNEISVVTGTSAISLVNRYCSTLGNSHFVSLTPTWKLSKLCSDTGDLKFQVSLQLPILSPLKQIILGDPMPSIKLAKRSAALNCCKELHRIGELTDNLLPVTVDLILEDVDYLFPLWIDEEKTPLSQPGTEARKRLHELVYPECLFSAFPMPDQDLYLHILNIKPIYSVPQDNRRLVFYNILSDCTGYAILSTKRMPQLSAFSIFLNVGEVNVNVEVNHTKLQLTADEIGKLRCFHTMIFTEVMPIIKPFMVFDKDNLDNSFLIVPVDHKWEINWETVVSNHKIEPIKPEKPICVRNVDYELALVRPSYRSANVYIVTQICEDRFAESSFPTLDYYSYVHYFKSKHDLLIEEGRQPLLEVKAISTKLNCIRPRGSSAGLSKRKRADLSEDFEEHLVPELCVRFEFSSLYWLKATTLPSIIHRISQLLIADQLRVTIEADVKLGLAKSDARQKWKDFRVSENTVNIVDNEPLLDTSSDDLLPETVQSRPELTGPEFDVLDSESKLYSWTKSQEPQDIERNIDEIQLIDIDYYERFMSSSSQEDSDILRNNIKARNHMSKPDVQVPKIKLLYQTTQNGPDQVSIMEALTAKMSHDVMNLEILETLGDSFLKFFTSLFLTDTFPTFPEGHLTSIKGKIIGNRNLYYAGFNKKLPGMIKVEEFTPTSNFIAPAYSVHRKLQGILLRAEVSPNILYNLRISKEEQLSGYLNSNTIEEIQDKVCGWEGGDAQSGLEHFLCVQTVSDKTVADCVEALIGVYLQSTGIEGAAKLLQWFQIIPCEIPVESILGGEPKNPLIGDGNPNMHMAWASTLEERIGYKFQNRGFLLQAFSHSSYSPNVTTASYERLEFLGDAILDFLITAYIFENFDNLSPGQLTDLRSALVNNITFACLAVRYGLHTYLLAYSPLLIDMVDKFVAFQEQREHAIDDELLYVLLEETRHSMAEFVSVPKVLGDIFEALAGAIYLDSGKSLTKVWGIFYALMHREIDTFSKNVPKQPVRMLYETQGAHPKFFPAIALDNKDTIMVPLEITICGNKKKIIHGFGSNTKEAKCAAAKQALKELRRRNM
ncbi:endoribonuclease Dicer isoform X1 [Neodiprion virginianus]|uniref:endoribonuclease Dicer isoform X1 n=1 Tax=Neodiprion virginianus TaxID=2961670 RepID=UPI001EE72308|nr:endoribonuclease Dicer isoform X1 [Neodiprion virginianus]XP_046627605.1 endoribonuclease Dicer isoform X1 [Neodiprion virginianus]XP_046627606.1 endoribonuclease Dicer isoform X1 [Neodiprion virginianus]